MRENTTTGNRVLVRIHLQAIEPGDAINISIHSDGGCEGTLIPVTVAKSGNEPRKITNILSRYYDEIYNESPEFPVTDNDDSDNSETNDNDIEDDDLTDNQSAIDIYEAAADLAWDKYSEAVNYTDDEEDD